MVTRFVVHRHHTGRVHYDLRVLDGERLRSWSLLREPPVRSGERRLAIEREEFAPESLRSGRFLEEAFGEGRVHSWDSGEAEIQAAAPERLKLALRGQRLRGVYEMRHTNWYPGNRWILEMVAPLEPASGTPRRQRDLTGNPDPLEPK